MLLIFGVGAVNATFFLDFLDVLFCLIKTAVLPYRFMGSSNLLAKLGKFWN